MSKQIATGPRPVKPRPVARIVCDAHRPRTVRNMERRFLGEVYDTVEFVTRSVFVIMQGTELKRIGTALDVA